MTYEEDLEASRIYVEARSKDPKASEEQRAAAKRRLKDIDSALKAEVPERQAKVETTEARSAPEKAVTRGKAK